MITATQCRCARTLLRWSVSKLSSVSTFEARRFGRAIDEPFVNARSEADVVAAGAGPN